MKKIKLSSEQKENLRDYIKQEVISHVFNLCVPDMKDVDPSCNYEAIWVERQDVLHQQAIRYIKELL